MTSTPQDPDAHEEDPRHHPQGLQTGDSGAGVQSLVAERFSMAEAIGGVRGLIESVLPGLVFVVSYVIADALMPALIASLATAGVAVVIRVAQRTPLTQALSGLLGVVIGVVWASRSGEGRDYFMWGILTNAAYALALVVSIVVRWPLVGVVVELLRSGVSPGRGQVARASVKSEAQTNAPDNTPQASWSSWRRDINLVRRYRWATWLWVALFGIRLAVQIPLYLLNDVTILGTARIVMGVPLWGLVLWLTWLLVRQPQKPAADI